MASAGRLTVILPTLDEVENIRALVPALLALRGTAAVLVVDDGSTDGTREEILRLGERDARVRLVARSGPPSLTRSLQDGIDLAESELVAWMDADGTMAPEDLPRLVAAIDAGADIAVGSRFAAGGALKGQSAPGAAGVLASFAAMTRTPDGALGAVASWLLNRAILPALLGRRGAHDWTSGFLVARREAIARLPLRGGHGEYFFDLWIRAEAEGARVVEVPVQMHARAHGRSKTAPTALAIVRRGVPYLTRAVEVRLTSRRRT